MCRKKDGLFVEHLRKEQQIAKVQKEQLKDGTQATSMKKLQVVSTIQWWIQLS
jgi:hypothetical protein